MFTGAIFLILWVPQVFRPFVLRVLLVLGGLDCSYSPVLAGFGPLVLLVVPVLEYVGRQYCDTLSTREYEVQSEYGLYWERLCNMSEYYNRKGRFPIHYKLDGVCPDVFLIVGRVEVVSSWVFCLGAFNTSVANCFVSCPRVLGGVAL